MLNLFEQCGAQEKSNLRYQFWTHDNHPELLDDAAMLQQRMDYVHENPVRAGYVSEPEHWMYISAIDYYVENGKGLLKLVKV
ncbi:MAG: hypothetical protein QM802_04845 [Agriterribacter sp.]